MSKGCLFVARKPYFYLFDNKAQTITLFFRARHKTGKGYFYYRNTYIVNTINEIITAIFDTYVQTKGKVTGDNDPSISVVKLGSKYMITF